MDAESDEDLLALDTGSVIVNWSWLFATRQKQHCRTIPNMECEYMQALAWLAFKQNKWVIL